MEQPLISVVIPFYNEEKYLKRAVASVINQSYSAIEIILVDDGSTDNSATIAVEVCTNNSNCKLLKILNAGPGNARNIGIKNANGMYLAFLDADDVYHTDAIEILYNNLIKNNADVSICQYKMLDKNEQIIKASAWENVTNFNSKKAILFVVSEKLIPTSWGKLFKTSIAKKCKFPNLSWKEDDLFFLNYLLEVKTVSVVNVVLLTINCRPDSLTRQTISIAMIDAISKSYLAQAKILKPLKDYEINIALLESEINTFLNLLIILKIDWKKVNHKNEIWLFFAEKIEILAKKAKKQVVNRKKRLLLLFLNYSAKLGRRYAFGVLSIFKKQQINHLEKVKS